MMAKSSKRTSETPRGQRWVHYICVAAVIVISLVMIGAVHLLHELPKIAVAELGRLTNTKVQVASVRIHLNGSVVIHNLIVQPYRTSSYNNTLLKAKRVYARFYWMSLLSLKPRLKAIEVNHFVLDAQFNLDNGQWNFSTLTINIPQGQSRQQMPRIHLDQGTLRYSKVSQDQIDIVAAIPINATFSLHKETEQGYGFHITTDQMLGSLGPSTLRGFWKPGRLTVNGSISSKDAPSLARVWSIRAMTAELQYNETLDYRFNLHINDLFSSHSPEADTFGLMEPVFSGKPNALTRLQKFFNRYRPSGTAFIELQAQGNLHHLADSQLTGRVDCKDISILDRRFPYRITGLKGPIEFTEHSFTAPGLTGRHGDVDLRLRFHSAGFGLQWQYELLLTSDNMQLDDDLFQALSERQQNNWSSLSPRGHAAVEYHQHRTSPTRKTKALRIRLLDTAATYTGFPYPLPHLTGEILFEPDRILLQDVTSRQDDVLITINGYIHKPNTPAPLYNLSIRARHLPLDKTLGDAIQGRQGELYKEMNMSGYVDANVAVLSDPNEPGPKRMQTDLTLDRASMTVPYWGVPLTDVGAHVRLSQDSMTIHRLSGRYLNNAISTKGTILFDRASPSVGYDLAIDSPHIPTENLSPILPPKAQDVINTLNLSGPLGVQAHLNHDIGTQPLIYDVNVDCLGNRIKPTPFPYPLKAITGRVTINNDCVFLNNMNGIPDLNSPSMNANRLVTVSGDIKLSNQTWQKTQLKCTGMHIPLDKTLGHALPDWLASAYTQLSFQGECSLQAMDLSLSRDIPDPTNIHLDLRAQGILDNTGMTISRSPVSTNGTLEVTARYQSATGLSDGQIHFQADDFNVMGKTATNLNASIQYDPRTSQWHSHDILGSFYDGKLIGQIQLQWPPEQDIQCTLQTGFVDANLYDFLQSSLDPNRPRSDSTGVMNGDLSLILTMAPHASSRGRCRIHITDMQIGKISPLGKLLAVLSLTESSDYAFDNMLIDSYIHDDQLLIQQFDLSGEALAFNGSGQLTIPSHRIRLMLTARGRRLAMASPTIIQSLTEGLGSAVIRLEVTGDVYDPVITTKPLPVIEDSFKLLGTPQ